MCFTHLINIQSTNTSNGQNFHLLSKQGKIKYVGMNFYHDVSAVNLKWTTVFLGKHSRDGNGKIHKQPENIQTPHSTKIDLHKALVSIYVLFNINILSIKASASHCLIVSENVFFVSFQ